MKENLAVARELGAKAVVRAAAAAAGSDAAAAGLADADAEVARERAACSRLEAVIENLRTEDVIEASEMRELAREYERLLREQGELERALREAEAAQAARRREDKASRLAAVSTLHRTVQLCYNVTRIEWEQSEDAAVLHGRVRSRGGSGRGGAATEFRVAGTDDYAVANQVWEMLDA